MKAPILFVIISSLFYSLAAETDFFEVTVVGDRVNLRNDNTLESDVVAQADYGDVLTAVDLEEEWVSVLAPEELACWVFAQHIFEEREVRNRVLNVRGGPGTQFPVLGQLERGDPVDIQETLGDWHRITPPGAVRLWISRRFVQIPDAALQAEAASEPVEEEPEEVEELEIEDPAPPEPTPTPEVVVEVRTVERIVEVPVMPTPTPTPVPPEGLDLVPLEGQGTLSRRRGRLQAYLVGRPSRFMLVTRDERGNERSLSYLVGDEEELREHSGQWISVKGRDFWVSGRRLPVTQVEEIEVIPERP